MRRLVVAHPSAELYGSDLQLLESVRAAVAGDWQVVVVLPTGGPLAARLAATGADVRIAPFPVLRKALLTPRGLVGLAASATTATWRAARWLRRARADAVYVNTLTIPTWLAAARLARVPALCHVHEAEEDQSRLVTLGLTAPLLLARRVIANSTASSLATASVLRGLLRRTVVVHNGVPGPPAAPAPLRDPADDPVRLVLVGRLSPRKGTDVAVEAVAALVAAGRDVTLRLAGDTFDGYEWFEAQIRDQVAAAGLADRVELLGFVHPTWPELEAADVVLVPSRVEPFGNTAVEALLAGRPVVATATQGLAEIVRDGVTGLLVPPGDAPALAAAVARLADDPDLARRLARDGQVDAEARFSPSRYGTAVLAELDALAR
ncbi:glycosyltransferase family 4 protein [Cellulomonas edaphi]|uniref:Glycosyltransferase family 4 protein n=1 Tax=Cellulomonas edaphi TaxID=3053468 RepID=A0ABT7S4Y7_9CELL|nr:glycosyltransferase family 4 protein [Cellulomons edaphi]MDM7830686.1 glycosyltransferase family 4 protein [Cellulomons edaphi]